MREDGTPREAIASKNKLAWLSQSQVKLKLMRTDDKSVFQAWLFKEPFVLFYMWNRI